MFREGPAITIDSELNYGKSFASETFGNPPLHLRKGDFQCSEVEIYNFKWDYQNYLQVYIKLNFDTQFEWPSLNSKSPNHDGFCYGLKNQLAILTEGTVVPCCLDKEAVINLGSIFEEELIDILNQERSQNILKGFQNHKAVEALCQKCQFKVRFD